MENNTGYKPTTEMKKIHVVELDLLERFDAFCKKSGLTYYADYGTLMGAVRHRGFIPWDDDIDVSMMRPDYNRMIELGEEYFQYPYYLMHYYNTPGAYWGLTKLVNEETTCIEPVRKDQQGYHHGIYLDVFAMDYVPFAAAADMLDRMLDDTWLAIHDPHILASRLKEGYQPALSPDMIADLIRMPSQEKVRVFDGMLEEAFPRAKKINWLILEKLEKNRNPARRTECFEKQISLSFETATVPVPVGYDEILTADYGDYLTPRQVDSDHAGAFFDPEKPWRHYFRTDPI